MLQITKKTKNAFQDNCCSVFLVAVQCTCTGFGELKLCFDLVKYG